MKNKIKTINVSEKFRGRALLFNHNNKYYVASSSNAFGIICETMIFNSDENGNVTNWSEEYCERNNLNTEKVINNFVNEQI